CRRPGSGTATRAGGSSPRPTKPRTAWRRTTTSSSSRPSPTGSPTRSPRDGSTPGAAAATLESVTPTRDPPETIPDRARTVLIASIALTVAVYALPFGRTVGYPLMLLSTLAHEGGHGVAALLVGGSFRELWIYADGSGIAPVAHTGGRVASAVISAGGLVGPAC